jgi:hypothetical protein
MLRYIHHMLQVSVKFCGKLLLLILLSLCVSHPASALLQSSTGAGRAEQQAAIADLGKKAMTQDAPGGKSKKSSFFSPEIEPLILLLFGLLLFSVATGVKLKLLKR